ncbi:hypothetical protein WG66_001625 [Moniliophthora roreri]|nr:hypothetical protein WG66_001625 [Moniliophthora roreri]
MPANLWEKHTGPKALQHLWIYFQRSFNNFAFIVLKSIKSHMALLSELAAGSAITTVIYTAFIIVLAALIVVVIAHVEMQCSGVVQKGNMSFRQP